MSEKEPDRRNFLEKAVIGAIFLGTAGFIYLAFFRENKKPKVSGSLEELCKDEIREYRTGLQGSAEEAYYRLKYAERSAIPIGSPEDFLKIGRDPKYPLNGNYILTRDIDFKKKRFKPIGEEIGDLGSLPVHQHEQRILRSTKSVFNGTINGNGFSISNLRIRPEERSVLFYYTGPNFLMSNFVFKNCQVSSKPGGALISLYNFGSVFGCFFDNIELGGSHGSAPAFLYNFGNVVDCESFCSSKDENGFSTAGMVKANMGKVLGCFSRGDLNGDSFLGGIVCDNELDGLVLDSYSLINIKGRATLGGVCALNKGRVTNCYSLGKISGERNMGGVVAINNGGRIIACYENENVYGNRDFDKVCAIQIGGDILRTRHSSEIFSFKGVNYWVRRLDPEVYGEVKDRMRERGFSLSP